MASPQKENGYTSISNEILENIVFYKFNGSQYALILTIIRKTYGFNKKSYTVSLSFLAEATGMEKRHVKQELDKLIELKVISIYKEATFRDSREIGINKNYDEWVVEKRNKSGVITPLSSNYTTVDERQDTTVEQIHHSRVEQLHHQKRNTNKEIIKKDFDENFDKMWSLYPKRQGKGKVSDKQKKELAKIQFDEMVRAIERYKAKLAKDRTEDKYIQHGSTFFNSGYIDYLDENFKDSKPKQNVMPFVPKFIEREFGQ